MIVATVRGRVDSYLLATFAERDYVTTRRSLGNFEKVTTVSE